MADKLEELRALLVRGRSTQEIFEYLRQGSSHDRWETARRLREEADAPVVAGSTLGLVSLLRETYSDETGDGVEYIAGFMLEEHEAATEVERFRAEALRQASQRVTDRLEAWDPTSESMREVRRAMLEELPKLIEEVHL